MGQKWGLQIPQESRYQNSRRSLKNSSFEKIFSLSVIRLVFWPYFKKTQGKITQGIEKTQAIFQKNSSKKAENLKIRQFIPDLVAVLFLSKFFLVSKWRFYF